jgi:hypothetical protein
VDRLLLAAAIAAAVIAVALVVRRWGPSSGIEPAGPQGWTLPQQIARADLDAPDAPWVLVAFTSTSCDTCRGALDVARDVAEPGVAVVEVEYGARRDLHERYGIEAVPAMAVVDATGGVHGWLLGPLTPEGVAAALTEAGADASAGASVDWPRRTAEGDRPA